MWTKEILLALASKPKIDGETLLLVDVSGSMLLAYGQRRSRLDVAIEIAVELKERCESLKIYASGGSDREKTDQTEEVPDYYGEQLDASLRRGIQALGGGGLYARQAIEHISHYELKPDLLIIITDDTTEIPRAYGRGNVLINLGKPFEISDFTGLSPEEFPKWLDSYLNLNMNSPSSIPT